MIIGGKNMRKLKVHPGKRYLMYEDGEPFFYLGDTAWNLFHKLSRGEIEYYLSVRAKQGFNVVQAVALAEHDGLATPNHYGRYPLKKINGVYDPTMPDEDPGFNYWQNIDFAVEVAAKYNIFIALLPTWGDKYNKAQGIGPEIFDEENAYVYGKWIANRYKDCWNIIWVLGGDRCLETDRHFAVIDAMAKGIKEVDGNHLMTFHPPGACSSIDYLKDKDYIDFHAIQSGHAIECYDSWKMLRSTKESENKPFMDLEPRYEDHPACFNIDYEYMWNAADVRNNAYWNLMEGACGHTYGNHSTWAFSMKESAYWKYRWQDVLMHEGANQLKYMMQLRMSRPYFEFRSAPELLIDDSAVNAHQCAGRGDKYAFFYSPLGMPIRAKLDSFSGYAAKTAWFDPRTGNEMVEGIVPLKEVLFVPPSQGKGCDWVLIVDIL